MLSMDFLSRLNDEQKKAVVYTKGVSVILAGAGSGKTRVLVSKAKYLISHEKAFPSSILMITFTNKAANEMKERIKSKLGFIGTFHSFSAKILRENTVLAGLKKRFVIYDDSDKLALIKEILKSEDNKFYSANSIASKISQAKNSLISPEEYKNMAKSQFAYQVGEYYEKYEKKLYKNNAVDFGGLIFKATKLLLNNQDVLRKYQTRFKYILVDEFQDTNYAQYMLTKLIAEANNNLTVVGDFSQSIYSWRGADIGNLSRLEDDFKETKTFKLEKNYRSTQNILDFAYKVISNNNTHPILRLVGTQNYGKKVSIMELNDEREECLYIVSQIEKILQQGFNYNDIAILYRINAQSRNIEESFINFGVPYVLIGGTRFYERKEVKDILSYLRLLVNPDDDVSKKRVVKIGKRRFEKFSKFSESILKELNKHTTLKILDKLLEATKYLELYKKNNEVDYMRLENIKELKSVAANFNKITDFLEQITLVESEYGKEEKNNQKQGVSLMTLHQAKGLEFPFVFIVGLEDGILPHARSVDDAYSLEEERRLFYVGVTRAKLELYITRARQRFIFGRKSYTTISRFLDEVDDSFDII